MLKFERSSTVASSLSSVIVAIAAVFVADHLKLCSIAVDGAEADVDLITFVVFVVARRTFFGMIVFTCGAFNGGSVYADDTGG